MNIGLLDRPSSDRPIRDVVMRLPATCYVLALFGHEAIAAQHAIVQAADPFDPEFLVATAGRIALMVFLLSQAWLFLTRRRPILRSRGYWPRVVAVVGATLSLVMVLLPRAPDAAAWNIASTVLIVLGNYLAIVVVVRLGRSLSIFPEARKLVTDGPYRLVRHPLYVVEEIAIVGVFLQFRSALGALILIVHFGAQILRMRYEEEVLLKAFPDYAAYKRRTALLFPGIL